MVNMLKNYDKIIGVQNSLTIIYTKNCCVPWQEILGFRHLPSHIYVICSCSLSGIYGFFDDTTNNLLVLDMALAHKMSSVVFIMPYHVESLERVEKLLTRQQLNTWISKMEQRAVAVSLPKISVEVSHNLQVQTFCNSNKLLYYSKHTYEFNY